jgi:2-polyprenyl-3-methyl-5-hydroxy-6-metoxy-1,4-benzoquinol methylase
MSRVLFTGERLHDDDPLFSVDLARHHAAYAYAREQVAGGRLLDLGCGTGYGTATLHGAGATVIGIDRIAPDPHNRDGALFAQADMRGLPLRERSFDRIVSFQVIEHLEDPTPYLDAIARLLRPDGLAILTTPNVLLSDGVNPYHVHEYRGEELADCLRRHFHEVELLGVGMSDPVRAYMQARSHRIQRIMRLDPLRLRDRLPRGLILRLFAAFAVLVRRRTSAGDGTPEVGPEDFPIEPARDDAIDWLALCRQPR